MKIRNGFVSNSSSSSFIITNARELTNGQLEAIYAVAQETGWYCEWNETNLRMWTSLDNFDMIHFIEEFVEVNYFYGFKDNNKPITIKEEWHS